MVKFALSTVADLRSRLKGATAPLREETAINKAPNCFFKAPKSLILCLFVSLRGDLY